MRYWSKISMVVMFAVAMAMVEAAVVVYLRAIYYPQGFEINLQAITRQHLMVEVGREAATVVMLAAVAALAGRERWERFGFFLILFGVWDIFYYVWLKISINWPATITDWDVLFLIPDVWIGPVIAPVLVSTVMIMTGVGITRLYPRGLRFRPTPMTWLMAIAATAVIYYTFTHDQAVLTGAAPQPYWYGALVVGLGLYILAFWWSYRRVSYSR